MNIRMTMVGLIALGSCLAQLPPKEAPGVADPSITQANIHETICKPGYSSDKRNVPESEKKAVYQRDQKTKKAGVCCEVDHLISLELGGTNAIENLWAEPYTPTPGAHEKDKVENSLHKDVCDGKKTLKQAQEIITKDWVAEYEQCCKK